MSEWKILSGSVVITCPHCDYRYDDDYFEVSVCVDGYDIMRKMNDGSYIYKCVDCGKKMAITAELDIFIEKIDD